MKYICKFKNLFKNLFRLNRKIQVLIRGLLLYSEEIEDNGFNAKCNNAKVAIR